MNNKSAPAAAALILAVLYPVYWVSSLVLWSGEGSLIEIFRADVERLNGWDGLFVLIGLLEVYIYLSLRQILQQRLHGGLCSLLALMMAIVVAAFTATVLLDVVLALGFGLSETFRDGLLLCALVINLSLMIVLSLIGLVLAFCLLFGKIDAPALLKVFAILLLVASLLNLSVILAFLSLVVYPLALVMLALFFLKDEHEVEVV